MSSTLSCEQRWHRLLFRTVHSKRPTTGTAASWCSSSVWRRFHSTFRPRAVRVSQHTPRPVRKPPLVELPTYAPHISHAPHCRPHTSASAHHLLALVSLCAADEQHEKRGPHAPRPHLLSSCHCCADATRSMVAGDPTIIVTTTSFAYIIINGLGIITIAIIIAPITIWYVWSRQLL